MSIGAVPVAGNFASAQNVRGQKRSTLRSLSLKQKFVATMVFITGLLSIVDGAVNYHLNVHSQLEAIQDRISVLAQVLGANATAAIQFNNQQDALETLSALSEESSIRSAYIFDIHGRVLAEYLRDGEKRNPPVIEPGLNKERFSKDGTELLRPIRLNRKPIGAIFIQTDLSRLEAMKRFRLATGASVLAGVLVIGALLSIWAQRYLTAPLIELSHLAERIGRHKEHSLRAPVLSGDELGVLAENFNFMLDQLERGEAALHKRTEQLQSSNEQLEQFANIAAHDLQEPLRKVRSYADRLVTKCSAVLSEQGKEYLTRLDRSVERMQTLVNNLLEYSRIKTRAKPFAATDLRTIAEAVVSDLQVRIAEVHGRVEIGELPVIDADAIQIQQLLQNLIANALKFQRPGTSPLVSVSACLLNSTGLAHGKGISKSALCEISVKDNGIGFEEKYLDRIFEPFQRLHGREEFVGTGMGLAICKRIVERHGGSITAESAPGAGANFLIRLPVTHAVSEMEMF